MPRKKNEDRTKIYLSVFLAVIMISSILGVVFSGFQTPGTRVEYNDVTFDIGQDGWRAEIDGVVHRFSYTPPDVELLEYPDVDLTQMAQLSLTSPFDDEFASEIAYAQFELSEALSEAGIPVELGFLTNASPRHPVISCADASPLAPVLLMRSANLTSVRSEGSCIIIEAAVPGLFLSYADLTAFKALGVVE